MCCLCRVNQWNIDFADKSLKAETTMRELSNKTTI